MGGARVHMIKNLSQLKKVMAGKPRIEITGHCLPEYVGQVRQVTLANTAAFYSSMYDQPDHKISRANNGLGSQMMWSKAPFWVFRDGICSIFDSDTEHDAKHLIMAFRVLDETSQGAGHQQRPPPPGSP